MLEVDHVWPTSRGGPDTDLNLCTACAECNGGKSDLQPEHDPLPMGTCAAQITDVLESAVRESVLFERDAEAIFSHFMAAARRWSQDLEEIDRLNSEAMDRIRSAR